VAGLGEDHTQAVGHAGHVHHICQAKYAGNGDGRELHVITGLAKDLDGVTHADPAEERRDECGNQDGGAGCGEEIEDKDSSDFGRYLSFNGLVQRLELILLDQLAFFKFLGGLANGGVGLGNGLECCKTLGIRMAPLPARLCSTGTIFSSSCLSSFSLASGVSQFGFSCRQFSQQFVHFNLHVACFFEAVLRVETPLTTFSW
jgi:hypothetical protein